MGQLVAGTVYVKADGTQFTVTGGAEAPLMEVKRESVAPGFFKEEDVVPSLKVKVVWDPAMDIKKITNAHDMTVTCEFKNGKVYVLAGAYVVDEPKASGDDGEIEFQFDGIKGTWQ